VVFLTLDDILESHQHQIDTYGGSHGVRDLGLLESAIAQPEVSFGGQYLHADEFEMAAAYLYHLVMNHPFVDGNKRVGLEAALIFLEINDVTINSSDEALVQLVLDVTTGELGKKDKDIAEFLRSCRV
jgi:death-on-curing protein